LIRAAAAGIAADEKVILDDVGSAALTEVSLAHVADVLHGRRKPPVPAQQVLADAPGEMPKKKLLVYGVGPAGLIEGTDA